MKNAKPAARAAPARAGEARTRARPQLTVQYATRARNLPSEGDFHRWVRAAIAPKAHVTVRVVGLSEGRTLKREYRGKDYATNVLTFVLDEQPPYAGDIALCAPVVTREARQQGKDVIAHYAHLTVHGVLHLQGYEHEGESDAHDMEKRETRILKRLGYPDPYALPSPLPSRSNSTGDHGRKSQ